ncbi:uncharacterized protein J3R85_012988 [Psidium guajava]|nr:uncharacterized protein J3R85_012988 [Psidium guajava]
MVSKRRVSSGLGGALVQSDLLTVQHAPECSFPDSTFVLLLSHLHSSPRSFLTRPEPDPPKSPGSQQLRAGVRATEADSYLSVAARRSDNVEFTFHDCQNFL